MSMSTHTYTATCMYLVQCECAKLEEILLFLFIISFSYMLAVYTSLSWAYFFFYLVFLIHISLCSLRSVYWQFLLFNCLSIGREEEWTKSKSRKKEREASIHILWRLCIEMWEEKTDSDRLLCSVDLKEEEKWMKEKERHRWYDCQMERAPLIICYFDNYIVSLNLWTTWENHI